MLQQTQVNTVLPYYERWVKSFSTLPRLAKAPLSQVLKAWEGLGYYSRARNLHKTAKIILKKWGKKFPDSRETLETLPGIGRYTAGAIASIAFDQAEPILDGNVKRVLARIFALKNAVDTGAGQKKLWEISKMLVESSGRKCGDFNQSLMELGALVCLPENPKCLACPVEKICLAHRLKKETAFPVKSREEKTEKIQTVAAVIWKKGRVLLEKQPLRARWGGLWLFPQWKMDPRGSETEFLRKKTKDLGIQIDEFRPKTEIKHGFTKYRIRLRVFEGEALSHNGFPPLMRWIRPEKLQGLPFPSPHQKIAALIGNHA